MNTGYVQQGAGHIDAAGGADGATACLIAPECIPGYTTTRVVEWDVATGSISRATDLTGHPEGFVVFGICRLGDYWYMTAFDAVYEDSTYLLRFDRATGAYRSTLDISSRFYGGDVGVGVGAVTTDGTYLYVMGEATTPLTARLVKFSAAMAYVSTTALALPTAPAGATSIYPVSDIYYGDDGDGSGGRFVMTLVWDVSAVGVVYQFTPAGALIAGKDWSLPSGCVSGMGIWWDGSHWRQNASETAIQTYPGLHGKYFIGYTWYDSDATGGTHETTISPRAAHIFNAASIRVTTAAIPDSGGTDDADRARIYAYQGSSDPGATGFHRQAEDALTSPHAHEL